jgi:hypothetical protein
MAPPADDWNRPARHWAEVCEVVTMAMAMAMEQQPQQQQEEEEERFVTDLAILRISFTLFIRIYPPKTHHMPYSSLYSGISLFQPLLSPFLS